MLNITPHLGVLHQADTVVCIQSHSDTNTLCSLPPPSLPLSPLSWYSHMCNGINTLLRRGKGERTEKEEKEEGEAMEETGEVEERDE